MAGISGGVLVALLGLGWLGLQVWPGEFAPVPAAASPIETMPVPPGLPAPVERFFRATYGEQVPVVRSAILSGRGTMRIMGITFPARFRFGYDEARNLRSYFELTLFGLPVMKANEYYVSGAFRAELPVGVDENSPKLDKSANVRMWAEYLTWLPAALLSDSRVRWEGVDASTAFLVFPANSTSTGEDVDRILVRFDPATGLVRYAEGLRYQAADSPAPTLWVNGVWYGETPWASFVVEDIALNVPVDVSLTRRGP